MLSRRSSASARSDIAEQSCPIQCLLSESYNCSSTRTGTLRGICGDQPSPVSTLFGVSPEGRDAVEMVSYAILVSLRSWSVAAATDVDGTLDEITEP